VAPARPHAIHVGFGFVSEIEPLATQASLVSCIVILRAAATLTFAPVNER
jgi:hypothetical protein